MKRQVFGIVAGVSAFFMASGLIAGEETLIKWGADAETLKKEWIGKIKYEDLDGKLSGVVDNQNTITTKQFIPIEAGKKYMLSGTFKSLGEEKSKIYYGFICYDKKKQHVVNYHSNVILGSATTLAQECKKGDKALVIKTNKKWKKGLWVAFNAKDDFSDLPNRESFYRITEVVTKGKDMELKLSVPIKKVYPAGTKVRAHSSKYGTYLYTTIVGAAMPNIWKTYSKSAVLAKSGQMGWQYFRPGTAFVKIVIRPNYGKKKDEKIAFTDLSLKVSE
jgi:hypothetical protein